MSKDKAQCKWVFDVSVPLTVKSTMQQVVILPVIEDKLILGAVRAGYVVYLALVGEHVIKVEQPTV